jgi:hypothetical protein
MANPTVSSAGLVLNKNNQQPSRFVVTGTNFTSTSQASINDAHFNWDTTTTYLSATSLFVKAKFKGIKVPMSDETGEITVTVTNSDGSGTSPSIPVTYVDQAT